jgi:hypothetical protein
MVTPRPFRILGLTTGPGAERHLVRSHSYPSPAKEILKKWKKIPTNPVNGLMRNHQWPMHTRVWSTREVKKMLLLYSAGYPCGTIASKLGRSEQAVRHKLRKLGYSSARILETAEGFVPFENDDSPLRDEWTHEEQAIVKTLPQEQLERREESSVRLELVAETQEEILANRFLEEFRRTVLAMPPVINIPPTQPAIQGEDVSVVLFGDLHCGQVVDPREIEGYPTKWGAYIPAVMVARIHEYETHIARILQIHPSKKLVLVFLGDMVHGRLVLK